MKNGLILLAVGLSVTAFAGMMRVKTDVQTMDRERLRLVNERADLRETKRVLEAEWALLASPERLEKLVAGKGYIPGSALRVISLVPREGEPGFVSGTVVSEGMSGGKIMAAVSATVAASVTQAPSRVGPQ